MRRCHCVASCGAFCVIGPLFADAAVEMAGCWGAAGKPEDRISVLAGLRAALPRTEITHAARCSIHRRGRVGYCRRCGFVQRRLDAIVLCIGEMANMSGEAASRAFPEVPTQQRTLAEAVFERAQAKGLQRPCSCVVFGAPAGHPVAGGKVGRACWRPGSSETRRVMPSQMLCWAGHRRAAGHR